MKRKRNNFLTIFKFMLVLVLIGAFQPLAFSEEIVPEETIWNRPYLTGDWGGLRSDLSNKGITLNLEYTSSYQGLASGTGDDNYEYGGKFDAFINLDSGKIGLWEGGGLRTHLEYRHGDARAFFGGAILPMNSAQFTPMGARDDVEATSLYFTQKVGGESVLLLGKINALDLLATDSFFGGWGIHRFMNLAFVAPPSGVVPPVFMGAVVSVKTKPVSWNIMVFDPNDRTTDYFPDDLFSDGVNISISGNYAAKLAERRTNYTLTGTYSTKDGADLSRLSPDLETTTKEGSYNVSFQFSHNLQESTDSPGSSWGIYVKTAIADGNPNPIKASVTGGIGGKALFLGRPQDSFGIGYYYYNFSDDLQETLKPSIDLDDERGIEVFYSYSVTSWIHITGDVQYIDPAHGRNDNAIVAGLRTNIRF